MKKELRPWAATVLSFVIAGLGHLYLGKYVKGLFYILVEVLAYVGLESYPDAFLVFTFALEVIVSFDAYRIALSQNMEKQSERGKIKINTLGRRPDREIREINKEEKGIYVRP